MFVATSTVHAQAAQTTPWRTVRLHVVADSEVPVALSIPRPGGGRMQFDPLCIAPCEVDIAPAHYRFGVERPGRNARRVSNTIHVQEDMTLRVVYEDRGDTRLTGGLLLALGILGWFTSIAGLGISIGEAFDRHGGNSGAVTSLLGASFGVVCVPIGIGLALLKDVAEVRIDPDGIRF